ncbi:DUF2334 domain-containing protein [Halobaculum magnesiiphilum]|uniref:DUF2334 domain-containing protein n=1 Tax=Halobaculum magnesiiphilum TaxID=1017351 RepID=A0A8T8WF12_9EURY|nr:DUF2334 domain-containing protein [Halobaculum magnesiiphilum]QZP38472.1 DUF2334 domain-containing protein [Halobaculum magnesiiphilum]
MVRVGSITECVGCGYRVDTPLASDGRGGEHGPGGDEPGGGVDRAVTRPSLRSLVSDGGRGSATVWRRTAAVALALVVVAATVTTALAVGIGGDLRIGAGGAAGPAAGASLDGPATAPDGTPGATAPGVTSTVPDGPATATPDPEWREYRTIVVFRNDDPQPGYRPEAMRALDRVFVEEDVPVTNAVIPAVGSAEVDPDGRFCRYLRERASEHPDLFEFATHGYTHERASHFHGGSEFGDRPAAEQRRRIDRGTAALTACVGERPRTFVAPMNTYDRTTTRALADANYTVVSGSTWFTRAYYDREGAFRAGGLTHVPSTEAFIAEWSATGAANESGRETEARLRASFDATHRSDNASVYVQMLHYQHFTTSERRATLRGFIDHVQSTPGVRFMTLGDLGAGLESGAVVRTDDGWRVNDAAVPNAPERGDGSSDRGWVPEGGTDSGVGPSEELVGPAAATAVRVPRAVARGGDS